NFTNSSPIQETNAGSSYSFIVKLNSAEIVSAQQFLLASQCATWITTEGKRTDAVFGYATAESSSGTPLAGFAIVNRMQNGATVSEVNVPAPPFLDVGRLFVDVSTSGRSVLSIANPNDSDITVDFVYTDGTGNSSKFTTVTVAAHQHFSKFVTDDPLKIDAPGTLNFVSSLPVAATAFFTITNESSELLLSSTPIVHPVHYSADV